MDSKNDKRIVRELAKRYAEITALPVQDEKRRLWTDHFSLRSTRTPILATYGMWNVWCREVFGDAVLQCRDPFLRGYERHFRMQIFQHENVGDDSIQEPWVTLHATKTGDGQTLWGLDESMHRSEVEGGAASYAPSLKDWSDMKRLRAIPHEVDEDSTQRRYLRLAEAIGDILPINIDRTPIYTGFNADISTSLAKLRGLEQLMVDMYDYPEELHALLAFMRDAILRNNRQAEEAGHYSLTSGQNQAMPYAAELPTPRPNSGAVKRGDLWGFCAAQEFTLISPEFHEEFLLRYQQSIFAPFGLVHYGCCEDLTRKIDMLRSWKNLRSIAVTPVANVRACAEQTGKDYVASWRPNPSQVISCGFDEEKIRRIIGRRLDDLQDTIHHIHLKDVETLEGDVSRMRRWVTIVREIVNGKD